MALVRRGIGEDELRETVKAGLAKKIITYVNTGVQGSQALSWSLWAAHCMSRRISTIEGNA